MVNFYRTTKDGIEITLNKAAPYDLILKPILIHPTYTSIEEEITIPKDTLKKYFSIGAKKIASGGITAIHW